MEQVDNEKELSIILKLRERVFALFYGSWCPFCRIFLPIFERYSGGKESEDFLQVKIDDEMNSLWVKYDIAVVPTVILFKRGRVSRRLNGVLGVGLSEEQLKDFLSYR